MENGKKPAFYNPNSYSMQGDDGIGLTKREYFAGLAMEGILAHQTFYERMVNEANDVMIKALAKASVKMADALLAELERTKEE